LWINGSIVMLRSFAHSTETSNSCRAGNSPGSIVCSFNVLPWFPPPPPGSSDVPPHADEAGEPAHAEQRPLGAGVRAPPPGQEAPAAALRDLGRQRVTGGGRPGTLASSLLPRVVGSAIAAKLIFFLLVGFFRGKRKRRRRASSPLCSQTD